MTTFLWILAFALVLLGGFIVFLVMEAIALSDADDNYHTLSTYIKRARRRTGLPGSFVLGCIIVFPAFWLFGHLVLELW